MKMQEVILRLRESAPAVEACTRDALRGFDSLHDVLGDASHTGSQESLRSLLDLCLKKSQHIRRLLQNASDEAERLNGVNMAYREKLGPRTKKPKDDPRQMDLFATQSTGDTSTTARKCPRCKASAAGCEFLDNGVCKGLVYPTNPPQYDPCVYCSVEVRQ